MGTFHCGLDLGKNIKSRRIRKLSTSLTKKHVSFKFRIGATLGFICFWRFYFWLKWFLKHQDSVCETVYWWNQQLVKLFHDMVIDMRLLFNEKVVWDSFTIYSFWFHCFMFKYGFTVYTLISPLLLSLENHSKLMKKVLPTENINS